MVLFILFPGLGAPEKIWKETHNFKKIIKLNFLNELKKLGNVYTYTPEAYKYAYFINYPPKRKKLEDNFFNKKPRKITMSDINIRSECQRIYEEVKSYKGKFIPIGHSAGGWFAFYFSKMYSRRCEKLILIESGKMWFNNLYPFIEKQYVRMNNNKLNELVEKVKTGDEKYMNELLEIIKYHYLIAVNKMNKKLSLSTLSFEDIRITDNCEKDKSHNDKILNYQKRITKINGNKIKHINFINTNHFPWEIKEYSDEIIRQIKCFI